MILISIAIFLTHYNYTGGEFLYDCLFKIVQTLFTHLSHQQ